MNKKLKVLIVATEVSPYAKSGGLGDVIGSLPAALQDRDVDVRVVLPKYKNLDLRTVNDLNYVGQTTIKLGWRNQSCSIHQFNNSIPTYLIENDYYFNRDGLYGYGDDFERFAFFTKSAIEMLNIINFQPDIINFNDWQTGLGPIYLKDFYGKFLFYSKIKSVFTIHNIQYQGVFGSYLLENVGLNDSYNSFDKLEFHNNINFMKGGIIYSDAVSTVSDTYAKEIQTGRYGYGLDQLLLANSHKIYGITNGIDTISNNPSHDEAIYKKFDINSLELKKENKANLQSLLNLPVKAHTPIISLISRLVDQKGIDLILDGIDKILSNDIQLVILGTGDGRYEHAFKEIERRYPSKVSANIFFSDELARKIYASSDLFLMPSLFEPCGLGQIFAMMYGTIPIVRNTGGLSDTVTHYNKETKVGDGFVFDDYDTNGLLWCISQALKCYHSDDFEIVIKNAMSNDFSWNASAEKYVDMYKKI